MPARASSAFACIGYSCFPRVREGKMKCFVRSGVLLACGLAATAGWGQVGANEAAFRSIAAVLGDVPQRETDLVPLRLEDAERLALQANPEIEVAARRLAMTRAHVAVTGALDDPTVMYRGWGVPLTKPWDYNAAQNMFSVGQTFVSGNKRNLRTKVAESDVNEAQANLDAVRLNVRVQVRKAFFDLLLAQDETRIHEQHVAIARQAIEAAKIKYSVGNVPQQDVLKAEVGLTALAEHMIRFNRDAGVAEARLNTLLGRRPDTPIEVRGDHAVSSALPSLEVLIASAVKARPDLAGARAAAERSHREQQVARSVYTPDITLSAGYMLMPAGQDFRSSYMVEGAMNLPWLNRKKHEAEIAEAAAKATEQDAELSAMENSVRGQVAEALTEAHTAQKLAMLYGKELRPQAEATLQSSVIAYESNKTAFLDLLDSQMRVIDVEIAWVQAVGDFDARLADLEMATGTSVDALQQTRTEVKP